MKMEELKEPTANTPLEKKLLMWLRFVSQFGVVPVLFFWIYQQEKRLTSLELSKSDYEAKLIDCYRDKTAYVPGVDVDRLVAVIPSKQRIIKRETR